MGVWLSMMSLNGQQCQNQCELQRYHFRPTVNTRRSFPDASRILAVVGTFRLSASTEQKPEKLNLAD